MIPLRPLPSPRPAGRPWPRRTLLAGGLVLPPAVLAAGCGPSRPEEGQALRAVWWGNEVRTTRTTAVLEAFAEQSGREAVGEPAEWDGYWDRLATQVAAGTPPDVVQMDEKYLREYADRGVLADLAALGLDITGVDDGVAASGTVDGTLRALSAGTIAPVMLANPRLFEEAGIDLPDDDSWTWEELRELGIRLTDALPDRSFGVTDPSGRDAAFRVWVRQNGAEVFTEDGLGVEAEVVAGWYDLARRMMEDGATPPAALSVEDVSAPVDQRLFATGRTALAIYSSNQVTAFEEALGEPLTLLRLPSVAGSAADSRVPHQPSMFWVVTEASADPSAAAELVQFLVTSPEAGRIALTERGVPVVEAVREDIEPELSAPDRAAIVYLERIAPDQGEPLPLTPAGASAVEDVLIRYGQEVLAGGSTPEQAGADFLEEVSAALGG